MTWETICALSEIPPNAGIAALIGDLQVAIFNIKDKLYAIDNHDPISKTNCLSRGIVGCMNEELVVASPVYKQHFSLLSGLCLEEEGVSVSCYPLRCVNGTVEIDRKFIEQRAA